jgi:hypothetical protein
MTTILVINTGNKVFGNVAHDAARPWAVAFVTEGAARSVWSRHATKANARRKARELKKMVTEAANTDWSQV